MEVQTAIENFNEQFDQHPILFKQPIYIDIHYQQKVRPIFYIEDCGEKSKWRIVWHQLPKLDTVLNGRRGTAAEI
jgi:hypothetical protein